MAPGFDKRIMGSRLTRLLSRLRIDRLLTNPFLSFAPPGHFYSPVPDLDFINKNRISIFNRQVTSIPGIEINAEGQFELLRTFAGFYRELPFTDDKTDGFRYYYQNPYFSYADGIALYSMLRHFRPRRVIEIGSGFSSALMLDINDLFLSQSIAFTFIEPHPERLHSLLRESDKKRSDLVTDVVQNIPLDRFLLLEPNDILFIDSSHVAKTGSDVVHLLTSVLPILRDGVIIHIHDIFWPFEYPEDWIWEGRAWSEAYLLKAFLQFNPQFRILLFNSYLAIHHRDFMERNFPLSLKIPGGSLWIKKNA